MDQHAPIPPIKANRDWRETRGDARPLATPPPLGLAHFWLLIATSSVYLALFRVMLNRSELGDEMGTLGWLLLMLHTSLAGCAWAILLTTISRRFRRERYVIEPGQWLMIVLGGRILLELLLQLTPEKLFTKTDGVVSAVTCCLLVIPTLTHETSRLWRAIYLGLVVLFCLPLMVLVLTLWRGDVVPASSFVLMWLGRARWIIAAVVAWLATYALRLRGVEFGWLHRVSLVVWTIACVAHPSIGWIGVFATITCAVLVLAHYVLHRFAIRKRAGDLP